MLTTANGNIIVPDKFEIKFRSFTRCMNLSGHSNYNDTQYSFIYKCMLQELLKKGTHQYNNKWNGCFMQKKMEDINFRSTEISVFLSISFNTVFV